MRDQLKQVLMACVALLALFQVFGWSEALAWMLLPTLPLLAALYAMHFVKGEVYLWWYRFAVPWTLASMCAVVITPFTAKSLVATIAVLVLSIVTLAILVQKVVIPNYRIARSPTD